VLKRVWIPSPNYSSRGGSSVRLIVLHTAEGARTIESLGSYFQGNVGASSHTGADDKAGTVGEYVRRDNKAWTQANANPYSVAIELCGFAAWSTGEWNQHPNMLANCAAWIAEEAAHYGIPIKRLSASEAQGGGRGVCQHVDLGAAGGGHWDCGSGFPMDAVLDMARGGSGPVPTPTEDETMAIAAATNKDGRLEVFVQKDDGSVVHAYQKDAGGAWAGSEPGKPVGWFGFGNPGK
jgi:N-acetylmuramoyl-L-alanine amidase-like protein